MKLIPPTDSLSDDVGHVDLLHGLMCEGIVEASHGFSPKGDPDAIAGPGHALDTRARVRGNVNSAKGKSRS